MDDLRVSPPRMPGSGDIEGIARRPRPPWPETADLSSQGLMIGGVSAQALADRHGTPLLVVDEDELRARSRIIASLFPKALYAVKTFTAHQVLRIAVPQGSDPWTMGGSSGTRGSRQAMRTRY